MPCCILRERTEIADESNDRESIVCKAQTAISTPTSMPPFTPPPGPEFNLTSGEYEASAEKASPNLKHAVLCPPGNQRNGCETQSLRTVEEGNHPHLSESNLRAHSEIARLQRYDSALLLALSTMILIVILAIASVYLRHAVPKLDLFLSCALEDFRPITASTVWNTTMEFTDIMINYSFPIHQSMLNVTFEEAAFLTVVVTSITSPKLVSLDNWKRQTMTTNAMIACTQLSYLVDAVGEMQTTIHPAFDPFWLVNGTITSLVAFDTDPNPDRLCSMLNQALDTSAAATKVSNKISRIASGFNYTRTMDCSDLGPVQALCENHRATAFLANQDLIEASDAFTEKLAGFKHKLGDMKICTPGCY